VLACQVDPPGDMVSERMSFWFNLPLPPAAEPPDMPNFALSRSSSCSLTCRDQQPLSRDPSAK
jgi:hypothetical protein